MFLALKEIKYEKFRYGLITFMIFLIAYLIFMLSSLSVGLASENTQALKSWHVQSVVLNSNSNINLTQSLLTKDDVKNIKLGNDSAYVGLVPVVVKMPKQETQSAQFIGLDKKQYIYKDLSLESGRRAKTGNEVAVDTSFKDDGYKLGDKITLNGSKQKYKIVGFVNDAKINIAPIIYGNMATWKKLRPLAPNVVASGIMSQKKLNAKSDSVTTYDVKTFTNKLPGYSAQNMTFELMIGFLFVISLIVIAVFLYILTIQKMPNYAVLRAQGIPTKTLIGATISQSVILTFAGTLIAWVIMYLMTLIIPPVVPLNFAPWIMISGFAGMLIMGVIGGLIPIRSILKVDPAQAIG